MCELSQSSPAAGHIAGQRHGGAFERDRVHVRLATNGRMRCFWSMLDAARDFSGTAAA